MARSVRDLKNHFHLHRNLVRQRCHADCGTRPAPLFCAEDLDEKVGKPVDNLRHLIEVRRCIDHAQHFDDALYPVQRTDHRADIREHVKRHHPGGRVALAKKAGLDQLQTLEILRKSAAYSKSMEQKGYRMVNKQFLPPIGRLRSAIKGLRLALALGAKLNCPLPLLSLNVQAMASEIAKGRGEWDSADIISFYSELANV